MRPEQLNELLAVSKSARRMWELALVIGAFLMIVVFPMIALVAMHIL